MPPSPWWSARMTKHRYLTVTTMTSAQNMSDRIPNRSATLDLAPPAAIRHSFNVYSGLVPMSPNTTPSAPSTKAASLAECSAGNAAVSSAGKDVGIAASSSGETTCVPSGP